MNATMIPRHIHDVAALCGRKQNREQVGILRLVLHTAIKEDQLEPLTLGTLVEREILTREQLQLPGVAFFQKLQMAGHSEKEQPLGPEEILLRSKSYFVSHDDFAKWLAAYPENKEFFSLSGWSQ